MIAEVTARHFGDISFSPIPGYISGTSAGALNTAFLSSFIHTGSPDADTGKRFLRNLAQNDHWKSIATFYLKGLELWQKEFVKHTERNPESVRELSGFRSDRLSYLSDEALNDILFSILFPEGRNLHTQTMRERAVEELRHKRTVTVKTLNPDPVRRPGEQILFTSNILLTKPLSSNPALSGKILELLSSCEDEPQLYWYDHPVPVGIPYDQNETLYGTHALDDALAFEICRGNMDPSQKITCLLSASTTHRGLQKIVKPYLEEEFRKIPPIRHLDIYIITEDIAQRLVQHVLEPVARHYFPDSRTEKLYQIIGVDGEYGRHYSFLKAGAVLWKVFINPEIRATFKIDLDQVFPQEQLIRETGESVLGHFRTPLWGAKGVDYWGNDVDLSMLAGALVNESDIHRSLFTPDVTYPKGPASADEFIFQSRLPQALSTEAEMMMRYHHDLHQPPPLKVIQRIHVTGGTNGILIEALRKYRPFTPTLIGRAEDQAYLLSVLMEGHSKLRYLHKPGLIMRHDKNAFTPDAVRAGSLGKIIGDYIRVLVFSSYADALPWPTDQIKEQIDPFTGCFVSPLPLTLVYLRFALKAAHFFKNGNLKDGNEFVSSGSVRLLKTIDFLYGSSRPFVDQYREEKTAWDLFYDTLEQFENDPDYPDKGKIISRFSKIVEKARINIFRPLGP